ncbi:CPBP family intramembrane glutamic endopeptidase [Halobaculum limi]|uniref:CPBP family intramembrane glutamic endopeptidase n=1 Tax=Halobaculum limi TaxID=3031916 RepID=UPI002407079E|nr:type II CAAX endopeptidase family protein [Halobaculum sp. YSMS11]
MSQRGRLYDRLFDRLRSAVWNAAERRPRTPIRLLVGLLAIVFSLVAGTLVAVGAGLSSPWGTVLPMVAVAGATLVVAHVVDRRRIADLGLRRERGWLADLVAGLALGVALQTLVAGVGLAAGWFRVADTLVGTAAGAVSILVVFVAVGVYEELFARGLLLVNVAEGLRFAGDRVAVGGALLASAGVFGVLHAGNPGASLASTLGITAAGLFLGVGFVLTGRLSFPVGVHISWNAAQGALYGFSVSGLGIDVALVDLDPTGPTLLTGGSFGPEAGLLGFGAVVVGTAATVAWARYRGDGGVDPRLLVPDLRWREE